MHNIVDDDGVLDFFITSVKVIAYLFIKANCVMLKSKAFKWCLYETNIRRYAEELYKVK